MESKLRSNIWKIAVSDVFYGFGLIRSIYILYFIDYLGFLYLHLGLYEGITSITIVASDLFTGVIADRIGRRNSVLISNLAFFILAILLGIAGWISHGKLTILIVCGVLNGLEFSLRSGAKSALLYDTMIQLNQEKFYLKVSGRINAFGIISNVVGMVIGGLLFEILPPLPYWVWSGFILVSSIILITVKEPVIQKTTQESSFWRDMKFGVKYIFQSKTLLWLVVFFLFADVFGESYWDIYSQGHLVTLTTLNVGVIFGIIGGICATASYFIDKIEKAIGKKWILYGIIGIQVMLFLGIAWISQWYLLVILLIIFNINRNVTGLISDTYQNECIPSEHRATILSAAAFLRNGLFGGGIIILCMGLLLDHVKISLLFTSVSVLVVIINGSLLVTREIQTRRNQPIE